VNVFIGEKATNKTTRVGVEMKTAIFEMMRHQATAGKPHVLEKHSTEGLLLRENTNLSYTDGDNSRGDKERRKAKSKRALAQKRVIETQYLGSYRMTW
jgi:hypothetical protein